MSSGKKTAKQITRERAQRQEEEAKMLGGVLSKKRKKETRRSAVSDAVGAEDNDDAETGDHLSDVANEIDRRTYSSTITTTLTPTAIAYNDAKLAFYSAKERHDNAETRLAATPPTDPLYLRREDTVNSAAAAMEAARVAMEAARVADETARARWLAAARAEEAAAAARAPPTLTMEGVNAWLERNPLAVDGILAPPNTPLWWRLCGSDDDELLNPSAQEWLNSTANVAAIIGVSGCGKTRTMYELLSTHFGFYWTCARQGNGGSELLQRALKSRVFDTSDRSVVEREVQVMAVKYCILFLQWRQAHPTGTPFQWHVFQTTFKAIDEALKSVELFVEGHEVASQAKAAKAMIERVDRSLPEPLVLIVDEAQILASRGEFESLSAGVDALRSLLQPFVSAAADTFSFCLVTGTSLALQNAQELEGSLVGRKPVSQFLLKQMGSVYSEREPFAEYVRRVVGRPLDDDVVKELYIRFRGRARPVSLLAERIRDAFRDADVLDVAAMTESMLLDGAGDIKQSMVAQLLTSLGGRSDRVLFINSWVQIVGDFVRNGYCRMHEDAVELFNAGLGQLASDGAKLVIDEPLVIKAILIAGHQYDPKNLKRTSPLWSVLNTMRGIVEASMHGFLFETLSAPIVHRYVVQNWKQLELPGSAPVYREAEMPFALGHTTFEDGFKRQLELFAPEKSSGPDAVHTFNSVGALGQFKFFKAPLSATDWSDAVQRTIVLENLYSERASSKTLTAAGVKQRETRLKNKALARKHVVATANRLWPSDATATSAVYFSYVMTLSEPPVECKLTQKLNGRRLLVFSPNLCPNLFISTIGVDMWPLLHELKD